jgi:CPA2 family monovalent cation:H+ antiporter-2
VIYGDASQDVVLAAAGIMRARALLVTVPAFAEGAEHRQSRATTAGGFPNHRAGGQRGRRAGSVRVEIQEVPSPEFEAAIEMTRQGLLHVNVPAHDILHVARAVRQEQ